ncbi:MAG: peptidase S58 family protein [Acetobacteraceae bacterium]|nr:peptidase S58 family protein [Acetobacteraceae bacterium]MSP30029.1 peptidase S58 family protein [Acetobacteraceae bacterium]
MRNLLTDIAGVSVGHATDLSLGSGVTALLFDTPAIASVAVFGGAPGGRDTHMLEPEMTIAAVDAIVLSGGSAYGLDAAGGVQAWLREQGRGLEIRGLRIPLVSQAILFDLANGGYKNWGRYSPYLQLGYAAAAAATDKDFALGSAGAGTGATTATVKGGLGSASTRTSTGHIVAALVAVNAIGSPLIGDGPWFWAAPFEVNAEFGARGWPASMPEIASALRFKGGPATTIGIVVTDATLTKPQAKRLAIMAHDGLARAILPAHAPMDGDTIFAAATGTHTVADSATLTELGHAATLTMARAIARGVYEATPLPLAGAQQSWRQIFG